MKDKLLVSDNEKYIMKNWMKFKTCSPWRKEFNHTPKLEINYTLNIYF